MSSMEMSSCSLWRVITCINPLYLHEPEQITEMLTQFKPRLLSGLEFFQRPSVVSAEKVQKAAVIKPLTKEFVKKLSKFLDLDEWQSYELFQHFLQSDFRGSKQQLENTLSSDINTEGLLLKVGEYYFEERLHILQCLKYMLSYWQDVSHPYKKPFSDSIEALQVDDKLINKVKDQYKNCCLSSVPSSHTTSTILAKARNLRWPLQHLREQILLLEIMLLYYKEYVHPPKNLLELAKLFQSQSFGSRQVNRHLFDARVETLIPQISCLQVLILIVSFDLESLRNRMEQGRYEDHHLLQNREAVKKLDSLFMTWGDMPEHGPVMLSWAVFRFATTTGVEHQQEIRKIGSKSLQCNVFGFLNNLQLSEHFRGSSPVASTSKNVVYMLMAIVLSFFQEDSLGDLQLLTAVLSHTLTEKALLKDFWSTGLDTGAGLLLNSTRNWFPLQIHPFLELVSSLAGEEDSAAKVYEYLDALPSYTELLKENRVGDVNCTLDEKTWKVMTPKALYRTVASDAGQLVIPSGTLGGVFQIPEGPVAVRWNYKYSCWKLFVLEIDSFLHSVSLGSEVETTSVVGIVNLVDKILQNDWSKAPQLEPVISRLHFIIQRCTPSPNPPQDLIAACLLCLATVASRQPLQVWFDLQQTGFLPHCTSVKGHEGDKSKIETMSIEAGNFGVILNYKERPIGSYPVTIATLRLFLQLLQGIGFLQEREEQQVNFLDLSACEVFILREVFSGFHKWRFTKIEDREQIGQRCLELFNAVLGLHLKEPVRTNEDEIIVKDIETDILGYSRSSTVLQHVLVHGLLCTEAGGSLLEILGTGEDTIDKMILWGGWTGSHAMALVRLIKLAFSVLNRLLVKRGKGCEISPLEHALSTQVMHQFRDSSGAAYGANIGHSHLVTVIASYVYHRLDSKLPTLAALLLKRLCLVAPMSMYASFGNEAVALRDAYVSRLQNMTEDVRLKVAILDFIATAVESQPGLIELFLNLTLKVGDNQEYQIGPSSCLKAVLSVIDPKNQDDHHIPSAFIAAAQMLLHALWHDRRDKALVAVRSSPNFWEHLTKPLFTDIPSTDEEDLRYQLDTVSYVFQIVALEAYYVSSGRVDAGLKAVLQRFSTKGRYLYWSKCLRRSTTGEETSHDCCEEQLKLLRSWRTFLVVSSSSQLEIFGLRDSSLRLHILRDCLEALKLQVSGPVTGGTMATASEFASLLLMLLTKWKGCIQNENEVFAGLVDVLEFAHKNDKQVLMRVRLPVFSAISVLLQHTRNERKSHTLDSSYAMALLPVACDPLEYLNGTLRRHDQQLDRVLVMSVLIIDEILSILLANPGQWLPVLREHALFSSLVQALDICIRGRENLEFTEAVLHLFLSLSRIYMGAESLALNGVSQPLCLSLASLFSSLDAERGREVSQQRETGTRQKIANPQSLWSYKQWSYVWQLSLAVMASMLRTLRHGFLKEALDFAGVHRERLAQVMDSVRRSQTTTILAEAEEVTAFLFELAHFSSEWRFSLPDVLSLLQLRAGILCQTCLAVLLRPRLLAHLLEMNSGVSIRDGSPALTEVNVTLSGSYSRGLLRSYSTTEDEVIRTNPLVIKTQSQLLKILCNGLAMFRHFTPDICQILMDDLMDVEGHAPLITLVFSSPALDHEEPLSFGTLLACLNMCLTNLSPGDIRSPVRSPVKTASEILPRHLLMFAVENAVTLALSQASRYLKDPTVDLRVKQLLKRELGSELDNFLGGLFRHFVRRGCPPSPTGAGASPAGSAAKRTPSKTIVFSEAPEQQFFKLTDTFVKQMLR